MKQQNIIMYDDKTGETIMQFPITKFENLEGVATIAQGGTGATDSATARTNLGLKSLATLDNVPVAKGGTGATTASQACIKLGIFNADGHLTLPNGTEFWIE